MAEVTDVNRDSYINLYPIIHRTIYVSGIVQGVGFRPFAVRLAGERNIGGSVCNARGQVIIDAYGTVDNLTRFTRDLEERKPAGSYISDIKIEDRSTNGKPLTDDAKDGSSVRSSCNNAEFNQASALDNVTHGYTTYTRGFVIVNSGEAGEGPVMPAADMAVCGDCLRDLDAPDDPRYRNPFVSCISCGPRFSIMGDIPYDRINTSMNAFPLCPSCETQYRDISDRRFHAQTICCNECGPTLHYRCRRRGGLTGRNALEAAIAALLRREVIAVKGVGGYHLACSAYDNQVVLTLRAAKAREQKPFAVMFADMASVREHCVVSASEEALLTEAARPIVLLRRKKSSGVAEAVYATSPRLGAFLPYTPLQHLILRETGPLVMTSANISALPIIRDDADMLRFFNERLELGGVLWHERRILHSLDDSVVMAIENETSFIRRARGHVPTPLRLSPSANRQPMPQQSSPPRQQPSLPQQQSPPPQLSSLLHHPSPSSPIVSRLFSPTTPSAILACGAQEKSCICLYRDGYAYLSAEIGDLDTLEIETHYHETVADMQNLLSIKPEQVICDLHPGYASTRYAEELKIPMLRVQHHHAHIASVMAEHNLAEPVIGVAFDGTGYGDDGSVWGGEFLSASPEGFTRLGHIKTVTLLGSDESVRQGWKSAACMLYCAGVESTGDSRSTLVRTALSQGINTVRSSSIGRVFDAISAILGLCDFSSYGGQCAMELENAALNYIWNADAHADNLKYNQAKDSSYSHMNDVSYNKAHDLSYYIYEDDGLVIADFAPCIREIYARRADGEDAGALAWLFHIAVCRMILDVCVQIADKTGIRKVALGGGVFANKILIENAVPMLRRAGFEVYRNMRVPAGDGGISLGQAYVGLFHKQA